MQMEANQSEPSPGLLPSACIVNLRPVSRRDLARLSRVACTLRELAPPVALRHFGSNFGLFLCHVTKHLTRCRHNV